MPAKSRLIWHHEIHNFKGPANADPRVEGDVLSSSLPFSKHQKEQMHTYKCTAHLLE